MRWRRSPTSSRCPTAPSTARRCWSRSTRGGIDAVAEALVGIGASIRSSALVGSHATRYTVPDKPAIRLPQAVDKGRRMTRSEAEQ